MRFSRFDIDGPVLVTPTPHEDERGFFARIFCEEEFAAEGLPTRFPQSNISFNTKAGTVRGMHFAAAPVDETKLVRCTQGAIQDVLIDLRPSSATYLSSVSVRLGPDTRAALFIPSGFAHGFQTLEDNTEVLYMMGAAFTPGAGRGVRWSDPAFDVSWPLPVSVISDRDATYPDIDPAVGCGAA